LEIGGTLLPDATFDQLPLPDGSRLGADDLGGKVTLRINSQPAQSLFVVRRASRIELGVADSRTPNELMLWAVSYWLFARYADCQELCWELPEVPPTALRSGLLTRGTDSAAWVTRRDMFWQLQHPWLRASAGAGYPQTMRISDGRRHPLRPPKVAGEAYRRFDPRLGAWISLRALDIATDLERFSRWQNTPRVQHFWQEGGTLDRHRRYLERLAADPHTTTIIGCFDDEPFAYFEVYWAKEDRISPFYAAQDYDRGIHMLVGEEAHRGPHKVTSWLSALIHYLFLDETRTETLVAEPRCDNARMISYMQAHGFYREKEFDFPHKRAALMVLRREAFFDRCRLC
jgi:acetyl CoA:N6-hydroxylysine acetyl transferase